MLRIGAILEKTVSTELRTVTGSILLTVVRTEITFRFSKFGFLFAGLDLLLKILTRMI